MRELKKTNRSRLTRSLHPMPALVLQALKECKLLDAYRNRPAYQQNDYVGWISRAKLAATREKRLGQMLDELKRGDVYMNMHYAQGTRGPSVAAVRGRRPAAACTRAESD
jgi:Bacteriocin-protection, YdeI or OmpD-Associated